MSVIVKLIGENDNSDEYAAARRLKESIEKSIPKTSFGEVVLFPSATLYGQTVKDVDIMMIGLLHNCPIEVDINHDGILTKEKVLINSFCTTIEVKAHSITRIRKEGTNLQVFYANSGWHNATKQSNDQKVSAINFFKQTLGESPFVTNLIWFTEITGDELNNLLSVDNHIMLSNALPSTFGFQEIAQKLVIQRKPWKSVNQFYFDCGFNGRDVDNYMNPLMLFSRVKNGIGKLTRRKIEQITNAKLTENELNLEDETFKIFRGRAGSGKTIDLIKIAIKLVNEKDSRVQILTYNRALVSDIRRLFALAELPDMFEDKCVSINTLQSYFYELINECLYNGKLSGDDYLDRYESLVKEMISFLSSDNDSREILTLLCEDNPKLNWDYILIDEAQDWSSNERDLILRLFDKSRIIVADGGRQFVRNISSCDWTIIPNRFNIRLKYCLRQKRNIVSFINHYSRQLSPTYNDAIPLDQMVGGKVIIVRDQNRLIHTIKNEKSELIKAGNEAYDLLLITPSTLVEENGNGRRFVLKQQFERNGILLWDGTNDNNRSDFSVVMEESRVLQYESVRGLEGWTVCCLNFDEYMMIKERQYVPSNENNALFLENATEKKQKYLLNWALIPLTRAIDTLVISLQNEESYYSRMLLALADSYPDYVSVV